jgi:GNAT superfamily N-acetyltransferase
MLHVRVATPDDLPALTAFVRHSRRLHDLGDYGQWPPRAAGAYALGLWLSLVTDRTCILAERHGEIAGCVGWSYRRAHRSIPPVPGERASSPLDPATTPAQHHALIVRPRWARGGLARRLLRACERAAREAGYRRLELLATAAEESFYAACGFTILDRVDIRLSDEMTIATLRMRKGLAPAKTPTLLPVAGARSAAHLSGNATLSRLVPPLFSPLAAIEHGTDHSL